MKPLRWRAAVALVALEERFEAPDCSLGARELARGWWWVVAGGGTGEGVLEDGHADVFGGGHRGSVARTMRGWNAQGESKREVECGYMRGGA